MAKSRKPALLVGESWMTVATHYKGFDHFVSGGYETGLAWFRKAMEERGVEFVHMPAHEAAGGFPMELERLEGYGVIILSDVGADTFLLHPRTWLHGERTPNRLRLIAEYVENGGGLIMAGGYMSFQGINGAARYHDSPLAEVLPVEMTPYDDRCERPEGVEPHAAAPHPITEGLPGTWPHLLGYNRVKAKEEPGVETLATVGEDALLVIGTHGGGRTIAWTSDIGPHWCPKGFAEWHGYCLLWSRMIEWASGYL